MRDLQSLVGSEISVLIPSLDPKIFQRVRLHGVELSGIWIESQTFTEFILTQLHTATAPKTLILFLPWHQVSVILGSADGPSLSEKAFGL